MAGAAGFEPTNVGTKSRCLTTWRRPNICIGYKSLYHTTDEQSVSPKADVDVGKFHQQKAYTAKKIILQDFFYIFCMFL